MISGISRFKPFQVLSVKVFLENFHLDNLQCKSLSEMQHIDNIFSEFWCPFDFVWAVIIFLNFLEGFHLSEYKNTNFFDYFSSFQLLSVLKVNNTYVCQGWNAGFKIMVEYRTMSDQNENLSDQMKNTPDILSERKNLR